mmetsp:Transcript_41588/g.112289  ORF Transcript_41588/g.112289 Transcript_41588/m.112289 type:complete len:202 (+) Transcript_41588:328-933(+)
MVPTRQALRLVQDSETARPAVLVRRLCPSIVLHPRREELPSLHRRPAHRRQEEQPHLEVKIDPLLNKAGARVEALARQQLLQAVAQLILAAEDEDVLGLPRPPQLHDALHHAALVGRCQRRGRRPFLGRHSTGRPPQEGAPLLQQLQLREGLACGTPQVPQGVGHDHRDGRGRPGKRICRQRRHPRLRGDELVLVCWMREA